MPKTENVTMPEMQDRASAAAGQEPATNSPEDLGYTDEQWKDFTPEQRRALRKVFGEIEEINLPRYLWVNVGQKTIQDKKTGDDTRKSRIESLKQVDGKLILQGAEQGREGVRDGYGWTIAIMEDTGQMVLTASGDLAAVAAFGACTPY